MSLRLMKALYLSRFNVPGSEPNSLWKVCLQYVWWLNSYIFWGFKFSLHDYGNYNLWDMMFSSVREVY